MKPEEELATLYFRLNGYFTLPNFVLHGRGSQRTEADVLAVRFPFSKEFESPDSQDGQMVDDSKLILNNGKIDLVIAEVKHDICCLNGPWTDPDKKNMEYILLRLGPESFSENLKQLNGVSKTLYRDSFYESPGDGGYLVRLVCIGSDHNSELSSKVRQILWPHVAQFIACRFKGHKDYKRDHDQWDNFTNKIWKLVEYEPDEENASNKILECVGLQVQ